MARGGAQSLAQMLRAVIVMALVAGAAAGVWLLRPAPSYSSEDVTAGSPFDVTFRVENKDAWFPLANLNISCVLAHVRAEPIAPTLIAATNVRLAATGTNTGATGLEPGESGTFTCPFLSFLDHETKDDPGVATRAEIYFRSDYDVPLPGSLRLSNDSARFFLDTRLLPPRWVRTPRPRSGNP